MSIHPDTASPDEEPLTIIATKVQRAVDQQELLQKRRFWDRFILPAVFTGAFLLVAWLLWIRDMTNSNTIYVAQARAEITALSADLNSLRDKIADAGGVTDKTLSISTELRVLDRRLTVLEVKCEPPQPPGRSR